MSGAGLKIFFELSTIPVFGTRLLRGIPQNMKIHTVMQNKIIEAFLRSLMPDADDDIRHLWVMIYRQLAKAKPVSIHNLATLCDLGEPEIKRHLEELSNISFNDDGDIIGFLGLTISKTPHELHIDNKLLYTWCAWDTLFIPEILAKKAIIYSKCPQTGATIRLEVTPDTIEKVEPETVIMSFVEISETGDNLRNNFCCHVHFFSSKSALEKWQQSHKNITAMKLSDALELAKRHNKQQFFPY
jgi:alkylmercury lyase